MERSSICRNGTQTPSRFEYKTIQYNTQYNRILLQFLALQCNNIILLLVFEYNKWYLLLFLFCYSASVLIDWHTLIRNEMTWGMGCRGGGICGREDIRNTKKQQIVHARRRYAMRCRAMRFRENTRASGMCAYHHASVAMVRCRVKRFPEGIRPCGVYAHQWGTATPWTKQPLEVNTLLNETRLNGNAYDIVLTGNWLKE